MAESYVERWARERREAEQNGRGQREAEKAQKTAQKAQKGKVKDNAERKAERVEGHETTGKKE